MCSGARLMLLRLLGPAGAFEQKVTVSNSGCPLVPIVVLGYVYG